MLAIRMQRTGRKGHAMFRMVVQDARRTPTSGKIVAYLGSYDPHSKTVNIDKEKVGFYLENGAQPSPRAVSLLKAEKVKLPAFVEQSKKNKKRAVRNPEKRRSTAPKDAQATKTPAPAEEKESAPEAEAEATTADTEPTNTEA